MVGLKILGKYETKISFMFFLLIILQVSACKRLKRFTVKFLQPGLFKVSHVLILIYKIAFNMLLFLLLMNIFHKYIYRVRGYKQILKILQHSKNEKGKLLVISSQFHVSLKRSLKRRFHRDVYLHYCYSMIQNLSLRLFPSAQSQFSLANKIHINTDLKAYSFIKRLHNILMFQKETKH